MKDRRPTPGELFVSERNITCAIIQRCVERLHSLLRAPAHHWMVHWGRSHAGNHTRMHVQDFFGALGK